MNWGKAVSFRCAERESDGGEVRDGEREGLRLEREERARDSERVAIGKKKKLRLRYVRLGSICDYYAYL